MSQENVEIVAGLYERFLGSPNTLSDPGLLDFFDPAVVLNQTDSLLGTEGTFHGHEGLIRSVGELSASFRDLRWEPLSLTPIGNKVVAVTTSYATGRQSGMPIEMTVVHLWTLRDAKVVRLDVYLDPAEARTAAGPDA